MNYLLIQVESPSVCLVILGKLGEREAPTSKDLTFRNPHLFPRALSMIGLVLIALGTGGIKPCVSAFGGDQFEEGQVSTPASTETTSMIINTQESNPSDTKCFLHWRWFGYM